MESTTLLEQHHARVFCSNVVWARLLLFFVVETYVHVVMSSLKQPKLKTCTGVSGRGVHDKLFFRALG